MTSIAPWSRGYAMFHLPGVPVSTPGRHVVCVSSSSARLSAWRHGVLGDEEAQQRWQTRASSLMKALRVRR